MTGQGDSGDEHTSRTGSEAGKPYNALMANTLEAVSGAFVNGAVELEEGKLVDWDSCGSELLLRSNLLCFWMVLPCSCLTKVCSSGVSRSPVTTLELTRLMCISRILKW